MASADLYGACVTFLDGDAGDVRTAVNAEFAALLPAGSVSVARASVGPSAHRGRAVPTPAVDLIPVKPPAPVEIGIGTYLRGSSWRMEASVRLKALPPGKTQLAILEEIQRALVNRYARKSNLTIPVTGALATFARSTAEADVIDESGKSAELVRAVVRVTFFFNEPMGVDT